MSIMLSYRYRAARSDGAVEAGCLVAESPEDARAAIADRGMLVVAIEAEQGSHRGARMSLTDAALGLRLLSRLAAAGLSVGQALEALNEVAPPSWEPLLRDVERSLRDGQSLGGALESSAVRLPSLAIAIIAAGEAGGGLPAAIERAADSVESARQMRADLLSALTYPAILLCAGTASVTLMVGTVLPRFAAIVNGLGQRLPPTTRFVIAAGDFARVALGPAVFAIVVVGAWLWTSTTTRARRVRLYRGLRMLPIVGRIQQSLSTTRAAEAASALLAAGVPLAAALPHAGLASGDAFVEAALSGVRERLLDGESMAGAVAAEAAMTATAIRLIRIGEATGRLGGLLDEASRFERERAAQLLKASIRAVEPLFILLFGGVVALIAAALLQALYGIRPI